MLCRGAGHWRGRVVDNSWSSWRVLTILPIGNSVTSAFDSEARSQWWMGAAATPAAFLLGKTRSDFLEHALEKNPWQEFEHWSGTAIAGGDRRVSGVQHAKAFRQLNVRNQLRLATPSPCRLVQPKSTVWHCSPSADTVGRWCCFDLGEVARTVACFCNSFAVGRRTQSRQTLPPTGRRALGGDWRVEC